MSKQRFVRCEAPPSEHGWLDNTIWWHDRHRPIDGSNVEFIKVQTYDDRDANDYVRHDSLCLLFTDQAEYYAVCPHCRSLYSEMQWSGSTRMHNWRQRSQEYLEDHTNQKGWCEFCDPVFGNGGWSIR